MNLDVDSEEDLRNDVMYNIIEEEVEWEVEEDIRNIFSCQVFDGRLFY